MAKRKPKRGSGGALSTDLLTSDGVAETKRTQEDIALVSRAVREGWPIPAAKKADVVNRLLETVEKRETAIMTKDGPVVVDGPADSNSTAAARVLVAMDAANQTDHWNDDKNKRLDEGKPTEITGVVV